jgi:hypothetical protein
MREPENPQRTQLPVVQPEPETQRAGPLAVGATALAMAFIVVVVLYGLTRPEPQQSATAPAAETTASAPATETTGAAPNTNKPATTTPKETSGQQSQTQTKPPGPGDAATGTTGGPSAKPAKPPAPAR